MRILTFVGILGFSLPQTEQMWQGGGEDRGRRWEKEGIITLMVLMSFPTQQDGSPMGPAWLLLAESFTRTQIRCVWKAVWPKRGRVQLYLDLGGFPSQELPNPPSQQAAETSAESWARLELGVPLEAWGELYLPTDTCLLGGPDRSSLLQYPSFTGEKRDAQDRGVTCPRP